MDHEISERLVPTLPDFWERKKAVWPLPSCFIASARIADAISFSFTESYSSANAEKIVDSLPSLWLNTV